MSHTPAHRFGLSGVGAARRAGDQAVAVTADSASIPESHKRDAEDFARRFGIRHQYIATEESTTPITPATTPIAASTEGRAVPRLEAVRPRARHRTPSCMSVNTDDLGTTGRANAAKCISRGHGGFGPRQATFGDCPLAAATWDLPPRPAQLAHSLTAAVPSRT